MPLLDTLHSFVNNHKLLANNQTIIIGLSGGPDSVFLLHFLAHLRAQYNLTLIAAHLDHQWRENSGDDVLFCRQLCDQLNIPFVTSSIADLGLSLKFNGSQEEIGRKARRFFLESVKAQYNAQAIAVGHHAQDQQETFFIRLLRGASLSGLTAMKVKEKDYIRPLLATNKKVILEYLQVHTIAYLQDPSNESDGYLRNRIRKQVIPALQLCDTRFESNFASTLERLQDTEIFLQELAERTFHELATRQEVWTIQYQLLLAQHPVMRYRVIVHWLCAEKVSFTPSQQFFDEIVRFLNSPAAHKHSLHTSWTLKKKKNLAWVEK